jgi:DNA repair protein RecO (recombination protein O)
MEGIVLESSFILHSRPYRETSMLVDCWGRGVGRFSAIVKGVKKAKSAWLGLLQPFVPLWVSASGRTDLKNIVHIEMRHLPYALQGQALFCGFYINELLVRALQKTFDPDPVLFDHYEQALAQLVSEKEIARTLRHFERILLKQLGYELVLSTDALGAVIAPEKIYIYDHGVGFLPVASSERSQRPKSCFSGAVLSAISNGCYVDSQVRVDAKRLLRLALLPYVGEREFESARLFKSYA